MSACRYLLVTSVAVLLAPSAAQADALISPLSGATPIRAWAGTAVLSVRDPSTGRYRLSTQTGQDAPKALPGIADGAEPFEADIGPGPGGAAVIVFARCQSADRCRLERTTPAGGTETAIPGAAAIDGWESAPTVWGGRLAFARHYRTGSERVYARPLNAGARVRSVRVPGVPATECEEVTSCRPITDGTVPELELRGTKLAEVVHFGLRSEGICGEGQVRLVDVARRTSRRITQTICGLSGSTLLGVSLTATHLLYARVCPGDPGGCQEHSTLLSRYRLSDHHLDQVAQRDLLTGFAALHDDDAIEVQAPESRDGNCTNHIPGSSPACALVLTGPLAFAAVRGRGLRSAAGRDRGRTSSGAASSTASPLRKTTPSYGTRSARTMGGWGWSSVSEVPQRSRPRHRREPPAAAA
jgi:hypothetical protein